MKKTKHIGGSLVYDPFEDTNKPDKRGLLRRHYDSTGFTTYRPMNDKPSAFFNQIQRDTISFFMNFIFPYVKIDGVYIGPKADTAIETMGAGGFGVTIGGNDIILKIMTWVPVNIEEVLKSLYISSLPENKHTPKQDEIYTIKTMCGFFLKENSNTIVEQMTRSISVINSHDFFQKINMSYLQQIDICMVNPNNQNIIVDSGHIVDNIGAIAGARTTIKIQEMDDFIFQLMERGTRDVDDHFNLILNKQFDPLFIYALVYDVAHGLRRLHGHNIIHSDIKSSNLVIMEKLANRPASISPKDYLIKIIDFGGIVRGDANYVAPPTILTHIYFNDTSFSKNKKVSILYDIHCLSIVLIEIRGHSLHTLLTRYIKEYDLKKLLVWFEHSDIFAGPLKDNQQYKLALVLIFLANYAENLFISSPFGAIIMDVYGQHLEFMSRLNYIEVICNLLESVN